MASTSKKFTLKKKLPSRYRAGHLKHVNLAIGRQKQASDIVWAAIRSRPASRAMTKALSVL